MSTIATPATTRIARAIGKRLRSSPAGGGLVSGVRTGSAPGLLSGAGPGLPIGLSASLIENHTMDPPINKVRPPTRTRPTTHPSRRKRGLDGIESGTAALAIGAPKVISLAVRSGAG